MAERTPRITVLAGTNGAGKSSIIGEFIRGNGGDYFNPDEAASELRVLNPTLDTQDANGMAWKMGVQGLEYAIASRSNFVFETTLGGKTIPALLGVAARQGFQVVVWYIGLDKVEEHIRRVKARVTRGGHDIPEARIRERFGRSVENLVALLPCLHELKVFDNGIFVDLSAGEIPKLRVLLHVKSGSIVEMAEPRTMPDWAKPIVMVVMDV